MKQLVKKVANSIGYEVYRVHKNEFVVEGLKYEANAFSVGETPQGELTAKGAVRMIKDRQLNDLKILDICCGVGIIGLTIFENLRHDKTVKTAAFADINIFNLESLRRTLSINGLDTLIGARIETYLTDGLQNIPKDAEFDIIISNPPHFDSEAFSRDEIPLSANRLGLYDPSWEFHESFYNQCQDYLSERGEVWFLENGAGASERDFLPFIEINKHLRYKGRIDEPLLPGFFWMITQKTPAEH